MGVRKIWVTSRIGVAPRELEDDVCGRAGAYSCSVLELGLGLLADISECFLLVCFWCCFSFSVSMDCALMVFNSISSGIACPLLSCVKQMHTVMMPSDHWFICFQTYT